MFPDFIGIGAQKSGTTWLHHNLRPHPEIWLPPVKELHYFDQNIQDAGTTFAAYKRFTGKRPFDERWRRQVKNRTKNNLKNPSLESLVWDFKYFMLTPSDDWYASLFRPGKGKTAGEITPSYSLLEKESISHIHELMPRAKLLFFMRNPIERAWSHAVMDLDKRGGRSVEEAAEEQVQRHFNRPDSRRLADYMRTLEHWQSFYGEEQFFVGFLEDIHLFPEELLGRVYGYLGVDPSFRPRSAKKKIHSRSVGKIPTKLATYLAGMYREEVSRLDKRFGGYASFWLYCADRLLESPPAEDSIPYPLWESSLWQDWVESLGPGSDAEEIRLRSGVLSVG